MSDHLVNIYNKHNITFTKGEGVYLFDSNGKKYLDALCGIGVTSLGHNHPAITEAITDQSKTLLHVPNNYQTLQQNQLADKLCEITGLAKAGFANSGAGCTEVVLKMIKKYGTSQDIKNPKIIVMDQAFHGRSFGAWSASCDHDECTKFGPLIPGFIRVPFNDLSAIEQVADDNDIVAVLVEPVLGKGGLLPAARGYLEGLRKICDKNNWLLAFDEVQCGVGKTGKMFAFQHTNIKPDIVYTAKGLGNGVPIGAYMTSEKAAGVLQPGDHGSTQSGNPFACRVALTVMDIIEKENLLENAANIGAYLHEQLTQKLAGNPLVEKVQGKALMIGIKINGDLKTVIKKGLDNGIITNAAGNNTLRLLPPMILNKEQADELINKLLKIL